MLILKIAFRNIFRQRRRSAFTGLMMLVVTCLFSFFIGVHAGSYQGVIDMFTRAKTGHIQIHKAGYLDKPSIYKNIKDYERITSEIEKIPIVESWAPRVYASILVFVDTKTTGARLIGIDPKREMITTRFKEKIKKGASFSEDTSKEVIIGAPLAKILKAKIGGELVIITQAADGSIANGIFKIIGFAGSDDDPSERSSVYMNFKTAQEFLELENRIHEIAISIKDISKSKQTALLIRDMNLDQTIEVLPWEEIEKDFYKAMANDKKNSRIFFTIISLIVGVGILNTVLMSILERTREFGVLKALGTRPFYIFKLIVLESTILSTFCAVLGCIAGMTINYYFSRHGLRYPTPLEFQGVYFTEMRCIVNAESIIKPVLLTIFTAVSVSIYPAIRAARTIPVIALRSN
jgi:ABC-type lipoprotein release transport system permease subunit